MKEINQNEWSRKEIFDFFSNFANPFYSLSFPVDVTKLYEFTKKNNVSFYYTLVWVCTKAVNSVENFRYAIKNEKVVLIEERIPSFTDLKKGEENFHIVTMPCGGDIKEFCHSAREKSQNQEFFINFEAEGNELIYFTCLPWFDLTALKNEGDFPKDDSVPRISWGKYEEKDGKKILHMSLELNHRFIDGFHVGKFFEKLNEIISTLQ